MNRVLWPPDQKFKFGTTEEVRISICRGAGSLRYPVKIWLVQGGVALENCSKNGLQRRCYPWAPNQEHADMDAGFYGYAVTLKENADSAAFKLIDTAGRIMFDVWGQFFAPLFTARVRSSLGVG